jgi:glyceraldehyde-3-phosphate dehydrogenase/erythrose-4-phosphate dehydrogenase
MNQGMIRVAVNGYGVIGMRVAAAVGFVQARVVRRSRAGALIC